MKLIDQIAQETSPSKGLDEKLALKMESIDDCDTPELFPVTRALRRAASGNFVYLCSIVNAKSGRCAEDCRFCAQSSHYDTGATEHPLMALKEIRGAARDALKSRAREFSVVTSGKGVVQNDEVEVIAHAINEIAASGLHPCVSPGIVSEQTLVSWKEAGLTRFHHNLETAPSFFDQVCTTHRIEEDIDAVKRARALGLTVCCGGIFGMGESWAQRVELALLLRELNVDSVPINFLNPIPGTPMADQAPGITPLAALKTIALFRLVLPGARIILCGGREHNLRDLQSFVFEAGANALMIGNYLTTLGRPPEADLQMIEDLGMEAAPI